MTDAPPPYQAEQVEPKQEQTQQAPIYAFEVLDIKQNKVSLSDYKNKVLLIVNTASKCGFTPQYEGLEKLHQKYHDQGLEIIAFPCNQFGKQEPGSAKEIAEFCDLNYKTSFSVMSKVKVNGDDAIPLFNYLKKEAPGFAGTTSIKWNFTKFLVNKQGQVIKRFASKDKPESIEPIIIELLK
jgi:glutathione peroxidase